MSFCITYVITNFIILFTMQLKPNTILQGGKYRIEKVLGQGDFGLSKRYEQKNSLSA